MNENNGKVCIDDIVLCRQNHRELEEDLEIWRNALERRGPKVSRSKTEYLRVGGVDNGEELKFFFFFYLYIYPPDSQESDGGAIHRVSNYPDLLPEMPRYCCPLVI